MPRQSIAECIRCDTVNGKKTGYIQAFSGIANGICFCCGGTGFVDLPKLQPMKTIQAHYYRSPYGDRWLHLVSYSKDFRHQRFVTSFNINETPDEARIFWKELINNGFVIHEVTVNGHTEKKWSK